MFDKEISLDAKTDKSIWVCYSMLYDSLGCRFINGAKNMYVFFLSRMFFFKFNISYVCIHSGLVNIFAWQARGCAKNSNRTRGATNYRNPL